MELKLSICNDGYLMPDTTAENKDYDLTEHELYLFQNGFLFLYENTDWTIDKDFKEEEYDKYLKNIKKEEYKKLKAEAKELRLDFLTTEVMPEGPLKNLELQEVEIQRADYEKRFTTLMNEVVSKYWAEFLSELVKK